jgi:hypothetical protein
MRQMKPSAAAQRIALSRVPARSRFLVRPQLPTRLLPSGKEGHLSDPVLLRTHNPSIRR